MRTLLFIAVALIATAFADFTPAPAPQAQTLMVLTDASFPSPPNMFYSVINCKLVRVKFSGDRPKIRTMVVVAPEDIIPIK